MWSFFNGVCLTANDDTPLMMTDSPNDVASLIFIGKHRIIANEMSNIIFAKQMHHIANGDTSFHLPLRRFYAIIHLKVGDNMQKFSITSYQKSGSNFFVSASFGARLLITDTQYIVKFFFRRVADFDISQTKATPISFITKGIHLSDGDKGIDLYFLPNTAKKVYNLLGIP